MDKKICFFDIDGTLWDEKNRIPESTIKAIHRLQENGHLAFINTGRTRSFVQDPNLLGIGFDGIVTGCGTMVEYNGKTVFYRKMTPEFAIKTVEHVKKHGFKPILEGKDYLYLDEEDFGGDPYGEKLKKDCGERLLSIKDNWGKWEISKLSCDTKKGDREACYAGLAPDFMLIIHSEAVCELVPKGYSKGTGMETVCQILHMPMENSIAFGDSTNDLEMFKTAGTAVCMGNGSPDAKEAADLVTDSLFEDGIWNACQKLGLL